MPLSSFHRQVSVSSLVHLERQGRGSVGGGGPEVWVQSSLSLGTPIGCGTHPFSILQRQFHQGDSLGEGSSIFTREGGSRASSFTFSGVLQSDICSNEGLRVVETSDRFVHAQSQSPQDSLQDGNSPVCASVCAKRRLDGVHRLEGCLLADPHTSGQSQVSQICSFESGFSVQSSVFRPFYGSAGFHPGHGSSLSSPTLSGYPHVSLPGRLAHPSILSVSCSSGIGDGTPSVPRTWDFSQLREVSIYSIPENGIPQCDPGLHSFQGFSLPAESREAMLNRRRIPILRQAARLFVEKALRNLVFSDLDRSRGEVTDVIPSTSAPSSVGSDGRFHLDSMGSGVSFGSGMVGDSGSSAVRHISSSGQPSPQLLVRRLGRGVGAHLQDVTASGLWSPEEALLPINARELLAMEFGLHRFQHLMSNSTVAVFADNSTALSYLRKQGGTRSPLLNSIAQRILRWAESINLILVPQFIRGRYNVLADSLSRPNQAQGSEWTLKWQVFQELNHKWLVMIDLFATSLNHRCSLYFSPFCDPSAIGTDALLQNWDRYQVYAFPPWSMIPLVLKKLGSSSGVLMTLVAPFWPQRPWFPDPLELVVDGPIALPQCRDLLSQPMFHCHHLRIDKLPLHAWRLSSHLLDPRGSPLE